MDGTSFWTLVGGIGLFLLGMSLMTDGLMATGTRTVRALMGRVTRSRWAAVGAGATVTAAVQSSSATTLVTVSFVSAGLVSFEQSIGILLGANIGSTSTAWIVSLVGFKVDSAAFALPAIGIGALLRFVSRGRRANLGMAIAGFGLVFLGIDFLQAGMSSLSEQIRPEDLAIDGVLGTLLLFLIGTVMTVVMQSSGAATATTLAAVHAGSLSFEQAAALVIGQNVGTTATALLGAIGGTLSGRRAAAAHLVFNLSVGAVALILLTPFTALVAFIGDAWFDATPEVLVALFHTTFNILGVALVFPFVNPFARLVMRVVPERGDLPTRRLDKAALQAPGLALEAARRTGIELGALTAQAIDGVLDYATSPVSAPNNLLDRATRLVREPRRLLTGEDAAAAAVDSRLKVLDAALAELRTYLGQIHPARASDAHREHLAIVYATDHLQRVAHAARDARMLAALALDAPLRDAADALRAELFPVGRALIGRSSESVVARLAPDGHLDDPGVLDDEGVRAAVDTLIAGCARRRVAHRADLLNRMAAGELDASDTDELLDANRWLAELGRCVARAAELFVWPQTTGGALLEATEPLSTSA